MKPRYEREIEEILSRLGVEDRRPTRWKLFWNRLTFNLRFQLKRIHIPHITTDARNFLIASVVLAVAALLVRSLADPLLAKLLAIGAVVCFFAPIVAGQRTEAARYWRGRDLYGQDASLDRYLSAIGQRLRDWWRRIQGRR
jgi:hypothetical protein